MLEPVWKILFMIFWLGVILIKKRYADTYQKTTKAKQVKTKLAESQILLWALAFNLLPLIYVFTGFPESYDMNLSFLVRSFGAVLMIISVFILYTTHKELGKNWSPLLEIAKGHNLVTTGIYKKIRHPMYSSIWLRAIGQWLLLSNWFVGLVGLLLWAVAYFSRIRVEEGMMLKQFGNEYRTYMKKTGRLWPKLH